MLPVPNHRSLVATSFATTLALAAAGPLFAQTPPAAGGSAHHATTGSHGHHHTNANAAPHTSNLESPGQFTASPTLPTTSVNTGAATNTATAPSSDEIRGPGGPTPDQIVGPIGPSDAARVVQAQMPRLRPCYETARSSHPQLAGRVELRFTIDRAGRVTQAAAVGLPEAPEVSTCLASALRSTTFPQPGEPPLQIFYPVTFAPPPSLGHGHAHGAAHGAAHAAPHH